MDAGSEEGGAESCKARNEEGMFPQKNLHSDDIFQISFKNCAHLACLNFCSDCVWHMFLHWKQFWRAQPVSLAYQTSEGAPYLRRFPPSMVRWYYCVKLLTFSHHRQSKIRIQLNSRSNAWHHRDWNPETPDQESPPCTLTNWPHHRRAAAPRWEC